MSGARTLEQLRARYSGSGQTKPAGGMMGGRRGPGPGGPGPRGMAKGKPKNTRRTVGRLFSYVRPYTINLIFVLLCMLVSTLTSLVGSYLLAPIINNIAGVATTEKSGAAAVLADKVIRSFTETPLMQRLLSGSAWTDALVYLFCALALMLCIYLVGVVTTYLQGRLMLSVSQRAIERLRSDLFCAMDRLPVRFFDTHPTGEIMSRYTNDVDNIDTMLQNSLTSMTSGFITLIGTFVFMITTSWQLTLITVCFVPIFMKLGSIIGGKSSRYYSGQQEALGAVNGYIEETVSGQKVVKVFNHEQVCCEEFDTINRDLREKQTGAQFFGGIMGPIMGNTSQISFAVTVGVGGILMVVGGLTPGALTVFANYSRQFSMPINMVSMQMSTIFAALAGAERVFAVMDEEPERDDEGVVPGDVSLTGDIVLENVCFGYRPDKTVLHDISLHAMPGQKVAFVGSTGAGKTTVTNLLSRFYDTDSGSITIDGKNIREYPLASLRKNIAMVLQDTHLFTGTIRENIRYGRPDATDEEVELAAKTASAHSFIMRLEHGYDTVIEGDGANLSQGQRQLLNIARAAVSKAPILVLDEATSSVDTRTERHIQHGMDRLMKDRTTFVIAHRLSTVRDADMIMVLEGGRIIERGSHDELIALGGRYYELYTGKRELD